MVLRFQFYAITLHKEKKNVLKKETFHRFFDPSSFLAKQQEKAPSAMRFRRQPETFFISKLKTYIFNLKIYISILNMYISRLEMQHIAGKKRFAYLSERACAFRHKVWSEACSAIPTPRGTSGGCSSACPRNGE